MRKTLLLIMSRKSGAGKSYLERELVRLDPERFKKIVSCTTRPPRESEVDGVDYYFISDEEFTELCATGRMVQVAEFDGHRYGSTEAEYLTMHPYAILVLTPESAARFVPEFHDRWFSYDMKVIFFNITNKKIMENMNIRGDDVEQVRNRLAADNLEQQWQGAGFDPDFVVTDDMLTPTLPKRVIEWLDNLETLQETEDEIQEGSKRQQE